MKKCTTGAALLLTAFIALTTVQCKKEDKKTKTELLTSGQWRITAHTANPGFDWDNDGTVSTDIYSQYDACEKDDYYVFKSDGTFEYNEGPTKCDPGFDQSDTGKWAFTDNESRILFDFEPYDIEELTNNVFRIRYTDDEETDVITFRK